MRIVQVNACYKMGSTGKIMADLDSVLLSNGHESFMVSGYRPLNNIPENLYVMDRMPEEISARKNILKSRITGRMGYDHRIATVKMCEWIKNNNPDLIHLHNIHGNWLHLRTLMDTLCQINVPVVWTLHDCWSFTGRCSHFELCGCTKWKTGCYECNNKNVYPITYFFDWSKSMYKDKKEMFQRLEHLTLVTPSSWLANYVKESYLKNKDVTVIHNGIDTSIYKPSNNNSIIDDKVGNRKLILGVANSWSDYKGFSDFIRLDQLINHEEYVIALIGLNRRKLQMIPHSMIGIERTNNVRQLVDIYSRAYVFLNLTYQDNYPTTNLEALSCGTPVITYNTGGSPESIIGSVGSVVEKGDIERVLSEIDNSKQFLTEVCRKTAIASFDKNDRYREYIKLYETLCQ